MGIVLSTTGLGISISKKSADRITVCDELIFLCELINVDLSYKMTPATVLIDALLKDERLKHLGFINSSALVNKLTVNSLLCNKDNKEISEFLYSFGKSDRENQIKLVNAFKNYITESEKKYKEVYNRDSKLYRAFGFFGGVAIAVILL